MSTDARCQYWSAVQSKLAQLGVVALARPTLVAQPTMSMQIGDDALAPQSPSAEAASSEDAIVMAQDCSGTTPETACPAVPRKNASSKRATNARFQTPYRMRVR